MCVELCVLSEVESRVSGSLEFPSQAFASAYAYTLRRVAPYYQSALGVCKLMRSLARALALAVVENRDENPRRASCCLDRLSEMKRARAARGRERDFARESCQLTRGAERVPSYSLSRLGRLGRRKGSANYILYFAS